MNKVIILDFGSGETNANTEEFMEMVDKIIHYKEHNKSKNRIIVKFQLFTKESVPYLKPLEKDFFKFAYAYCLAAGLECTASVFDLSSIGYLLGFRPAAFKIAARENLYDLIDLLPLNQEIFVSVDNVAKMQYLYDKFGNGFGHKLIFLNCIPKYPALQEEYEEKFGHGLSHSISDHTEGLDLYKRWQPCYFEKHVTSYHDNNIPDRSSYACTIDEIGGIL
jgi:sialic acid synthase SpsE